MSITLTIAFHGGKKDITNDDSKSKNPVHNNLHNYPGGAKVLPTGGSNPSLTGAELRGFTLGTNGDTHLYVLNGYKDSSQILQYEPNDDGTYETGTVWATEGLNHPFDAVWGPDGNLYVSNQDPPGGNIQITVYSPSGTYLGVFAQGFKEPRGITWVGNTLWVADEQGGTGGNGAVIAYALQSGTVTGTPTGASITTVTDPVHILYDGARYMYIGDEKENKVYAYDTTQPTVAPVEVVHKSSGLLDDTGGLAIVTDKGIQYLYACSRKGQSIIQYQLDSTNYPPVVSDPKVVQSKLGDDPEFVGVLGNGVFN